MNMYGEGNFFEKKFPSRSLQKTLYQRGRPDFERFCSVRAERYALWDPTPKRVMNNEAAPLASQAADE
jgi:hypothetical protein